MGSRKSSSPKSSRPVRPRASARRTLSSRMISAEVAKARAPSCGGSSAPVCTGLDACRHRAMQVVVLQRPHGELPLCKARTRGTHRRESVRTCAAHACSGGARDGSSRHSARSAGAPTRTRACCEYAHDAAGGRAGRAAHLPRSGRRRASCPPSRSASCH